MKNQIKTSEVVQPLVQGNPSSVHRKRIRIKQVDAFTDTPLTGNPAGVVIDANGLTDGEMQVIAREMSVPETAFILPSSVKGADLRIRWFSPTTEVPLCGHATIASFHALAEEGLFGMSRDGTYRFTLETRSGLLPVTVEASRTSIDVWLGLNLPSFTRASTQKLDVMRILNISLEDFESRLPIVADKYIYVPIRRLHTVYALQPNIFAVSQFLANRNLFGLCAFTTETVDRASSVHSRFFAPNMGINEDPVTGSANGPLGVYLFEHGLLDELPGVQRTRRTASGIAQVSEPHNALVTLLAEQGDSIGRKGRVKVQLSVSGKVVTAVSIGGRAVTVFDGEMLIA
ncbi:MAG: PhzF family phenazine biosynthesis protein [Bacteroidota bacterium]